jgi:hypothetical protein
MEEDMIKRKMWKVRKTKNPTVNILSKMASNLSIRHTAYASVEVRHRAFAHKDFVDGPITYIYVESLGSEEYESWDEAFEAYEQLMKS